jgi:serine protein kinase
MDEINEGYNKTVPDDLNEEHSIEWYLNELQHEDPKIARNAHQRVSDTFDHYGTDQQDNFKMFSEDPLHNGKYRLFGDEIHDSIEDMYRKIKSGARGLGPENRIKVAAGPVGSGKSQADKLLQQYFEHYTRQEEGRMYTFKWENLYELIDDQDAADDEIVSPMRQDPIVLVPNESDLEGKSFRERVLEQANETLDEQDTDYPFSIRNDDDPDPVSQFIMDELMAEYGNWKDVMDNHVSVIRYVADQNKRQAIGEIQPKDKKNQDVTELTGQKNMTKAAIYGESDPRSFEYSGAFPNANRGIFSGEELYKLQKEFLYEFLHATQEQEMKVGDQARADLDQVIFGRTNMPEFRDKRQDEKMEAFNDRSKVVPFPYILQYEKEADIYRRQMENGDTDDFHFEPHTFEMAGLLAVMSRIEEPGKTDPLDILEKARAYNGEDLGDKEPDVEELKREAEEFEGMTGISTRFFDDQIAEALEEVDLEDDDLPDSVNVKSVFPTKVFNLYEEELPKHGSLDEDRLQDYMRYLEKVEEEYKRRATDDVRHALAYDVDEIQKQGEKYFDNVLAYMDDGTVTDEITGQEKEPDTKFLNRVEDAAGIADDMRDDFRQEVSNWISRKAREGDSYDPQDNTRLRRALEEKIWEEKKQNINFDALVSSPEDEDKSEWIDTLTEEMGYSKPGAKKVLEFVGMDVAKDELAG